jgi:hypothetical protein
LDKLVIAKSEEAKNIAHDALEQAKLAKDEAHGARIRAEEPRQSMAEQLQHPCHLEAQIFSQYQSSQNLLQRKDLSRMMRLQVPDVERRMQSHGGRDAKSICVALYFEYL